MPIERQTDSLVRFCCTGLYLQGGMFWRAIIGATGYQLEDTDSDPP
jgi:hypothetical protein